MRILIFQFYFLIKSIILELEKLDRLKKQNMDSFSNQIKAVKLQYYKNLSDYVYWFLLKVKDTASLVYKDQNFQMIRSFLLKNKYECAFGSLVLASCILHFKQKQKRIEIMTSSDNNENINKGKKLNFNKVPQKVRSKIKFVSSEGQEKIQQSPTYFTENYESALQNKKSSSTKKHKRKDHSKQQDFERVLDTQIQKMNSKKIVLEDSKSDKIFNEMYGMYQLTLQ